MKINNKIKEIEKRTNGLIQYNINQLLGTRFNFGLNKPELLLLEKKIKNLKQFQKEIKQLQGKLKKRMDLLGKPLRDEWNLALKWIKEEEIYKIFKKRFGDIK